MFDGVELLFASGIYILQLHRPWTLTGGFHVMISCLRPFHTTCKSCYNLFHGFVDRQRVTVWSSAFENITCEMVSHLWELIHTPQLVLPHVHKHRNSQIQTSCTAITLHVYWIRKSSTMKCVSNLVIILFHGHGQNHQFCEAVSKLWSSKIRPLGTGIIRRHSLTRYLAGLVCSQTYT